MKFIKNSAAVLGTTAILSGAFGAHALRDRLMATGKMAPWNTAVLYHLIHAVAVLAVAVSIGKAQDENDTVDRSWKRVCLFWTAGTVFFSGSLYALALGGPTWIGPVTPMGGVMLMVGWFLVAFVRPGPHA